MAESVHNEVVRVSLDDTKLMAGMTNMGKEIRATFRQINASFNDLGNSGNWVKAYQTKVRGLEDLLQKTQKYAKSLREELATTPAGAGYDKLAGELARVNSLTAKYSASLGKAQLGLKRAQTGVMDLRTETQMLARETQASVSVFDAQGKSLSANAVKVSGYGKEIKALANQYQAEKAYLAEIDAALGKNSSEYREQAVVITEVEAKMKELAAAQKVAYSSVGSASLGYTKAADSIKNFSARNVEAGRNMTAMGNSMMITSYGIGAAFVSAAKSAMTLEQSYKENTNLIVKNAQAEEVAAKVAISRAKTDGERSAAQKRLAAAEYEESHAAQSSNQMMEQGRKLSLQYGESQNNIAKGYQELVKTGFSAKQAMGSMESILQTSRATGEDFNRVLDVTVQTMNQFSSSFPKSMSYQERAAKTNNILAAAANATSTSYSGLGEAMAQVGPVLSDLGYSMSDSAAIIGVLSNRGIDAAQAGNNLKRAMMQLTSGSKPTQEMIKKLGLNIYDSSGKTRKMADIMGDLQDKMKGMSQGDKEIVMKALFGAYARTAGTILSDASEQIREVSAATKEAGDSGNYVSDLAKKNMDTAKAQIDRFKAALTELGMSFAREMLPTIKDMVQGLTGMIEKLDDMSPGMKKFITYTLAATAAAGPLLTVLGTFRTIIGGSAGILSSLILNVGKLTMVTTSMRLNQFGTTTSNKFRKLKKEQLNTVMQ